MSGLAEGIVARDLVVDHGRGVATVRALQCAALDVPAGSSLAVTGPSGCGKSTLLGLLAGLGLPTHGSVVVDGVEVSALGARERMRYRRANVGMVYQVDNLLPHLTVEENVGLQLALSARSGARPRQLLEHLGLGSLAGRLPDQLLGGQRQRVAVARAVVHRPRVILADEPTGALDEVSAGRVVDLLLSVHREVGAALVVVTHDLETARRLQATVRLLAPVASAIGGPALGLRRQRRAARAC